MIVEGKCIINSLIRSFHSLGRAKSLPLTKTLATMNISYRSDTDSDFKCLEESIARGEFGKLNELWKVELEREKGFFAWEIQEVFSNYWSKEESDKFLNAMQRDEIILPTRFDSISQHSILSGLIEEIEQSAQDFKLEYGHFPHSSTIPTGQVNACAANLKCSSRTFLLFDSQLFLYCHLFSKAFALCLPIINSDSSGIQLSSNIDKVKLQIENNTNKCTERFFDVLHAYVVLGCPSEAEPYLLPKDYISYSELLRQGMELMVVGHEFGHVNAGHLGDTTWRSMRMLSEAERYKSHKQEFEADFWGCVLTLQAMSRKGYDSTLSFIGLDLFFSAMVLSERYRSLRSGIRDEHFEEEESESHPSFGARQAFLREAIKHVDGIKEHTASIQALCQFYDGALEHLWKTSIST